jgi:hypothetical protein
MSGGHKPGTDTEQDVYANNVPSTTTDHETSTDKPADKKVTFPSQSVDSSELIQSNSLSSPYDSFPFPEIATIRKDLLDYCISHF